MGKTFVTDSASHGWLQWSPHILCSPCIMTLTLHFSGKVHFSTSRIWTVTVFTNRIQQEWCGIIPRQCLFSPDGLIFLLQSRDHQCQKPKPQERPWRIVCHVKRSTRPPAQEWAAILEVDPPGPAAPVWIREELHHWISPNPQSQNPEWNKIVQSYQAQVQCVTAIHTNTQQKQGNPQY